MIVVKIKFDSLIEMEKKNSFQIYCCTAEIHQLEEARPDHPPEKKSICTLIKKIFTMQLVIFPLEKL